MVLNLFLYLVILIFAIAYAIEELDSNDIRFEDEVLTYSASLWEGANRWTNCTNVYILGGLSVLGYTGTLNSNTYGQYLTKTFSNLPAHNVVYFSFTVYILNGWDDGNFFEVVIDSTIFPSWTDGYLNWLSYPSICEWGYPDLPDLRTFVRATHSSRSLVLKFVMKNHGDSYDESVGFRDIRLLFTTTNNTNALTNTMCGRRPDSVTLHSSNCICSEGRYGDTLATCFPCDPLCTSCFGPSTQECYQCAKGAGFDGTACVKCDSSCSTCGGTGADQCITCPSGKVLYNDKYCIDQIQIVNPFIVTSGPYGRSLWKKLFK